MNLTNSISHVLQSVNTLTKNHKKLAEAKGEDFNVFSILKMERKENDTHSAFLKALLNPKGKHHLGAKFLELFLIVIKDSSPDFSKQNKALQLFNPIGASVKLEVSVGSKTKKCEEYKDVDIKYCEKNKNCKCSGGRIDIYLQDTAGYTICIENKIDAIDQSAQLKRYHNHNTAKNCVIYLNKHGNNPIEDSSRGLVNGEDYTTISYAEHIIKWLDLCLKETASQPILRETIKQYIILIKKITNTVTNEQKEDLKNAMFNKSTIEAAKIIANNYISIENEIKESFRKAVFEKLKSNEELSEFEVFFDESRPASKAYSAIWIKSKKHFDSKQFYGVESFSGSGHIGGNMYVGILDETNTASKLPTVIFKKIDENWLVDIKNSWWPLAYKMSYNNKELNLTDHLVLSMISDVNSKGFNLILDIVVSQTIQFVNHTKNDFLTFLNSNN